MYGALVWECRALNSPKRRFPALVAPMFLFYAGAKLVHASPVLGTDGMTRAPSHYRFVLPTHPLYARITCIFSASISETTMRPNPRHDAAQPRRRGGDRARSHCRFVLPPIYFIPDSLTESVPLFLKRQCDRTIGGGLPGEGGGGELHARRLSSEKDAKLSQKLGQLQPFIALL